MGGSYRKNNDETQVTETWPGNAAIEAVGLNSLIHVILLKKSVGFAELCSMGGRQYEWNKKV